MSDIVFEDVSKTYDGHITAVRNFSISVPSPTFAVLVGPSGCGKTTVLRMLAGLEKPTSGKIFMGASRLDLLEPRDRNVAMVFQGYALYPHMTVRQNLSFGLQMRKTPKSAIIDKVNDIAERLAIANLLQRRPAELSGGERQRVALGRAVIRSPKAYLFDEPLSSLDAKLRVEMRGMIKKLFKDVKTTSIYVTHDQVEAMTIGEMLIIMCEGRIQQIGTPKECYNRPRNTFVASFLGSPPMNLIHAEFDSTRLSLSVSGSLIASPPQELIARLAKKRESALILGIRPEDLMTCDEWGGENLRFKGNVALVETLGHDKLVHVDIGGEELIIRQSSSSEAHYNGHVRISAVSEKVLCFSADKKLNFEVY